MELDPNIYILASFTDAKKVHPKITEMAEKVPLLQEKNVLLPQDAQI